MGERRTTAFLLRIIFIGAVSLIFAFAPGPVSAAGTCGTGTWTAGNLETHHIDIGQGDVSWVVMADPEGNEFCVLAPRT